MTDSDMNTDIDIIHSVPSFFNNGASRPSRFEIHAVKPDTTRSVENLSASPNSPQLNALEEGTSVGQLTTSFGGSRTLAALKRRITANKRRSYRRLVFKNGECNISHINISKRHRRYLADLFTTLVDVKWRYALLLFVMAFISSWLVFTFVWYFICFMRNDFIKLSNDTSRCVVNVDDFASVLLFSIETQHTIGYGSRYVTNICPEAIMLVMIQSCFGVIIQALMTGLVFAKISRPKKRAETLMFSKNAVICKRDGVMTLLLRVGDMRKSQIIEAHIRGILIKKRITDEGEILPLEQYNVDLGSGSGAQNNQLFLTWPLIIEHEINETSPFWNLSASDLKREAFELVVILEGIVESTGMTTQARSSYLPSEILWGHRFEKLITYQKTNGQYQIDYEKFNGVLEIPHFPSCSAAELAAIGEENMSARGFIQDDDVSIASKSVTVSSGMGPLMSQFVKRNGIRRGSNMLTQYLPPPQEIHDKEVV